MELLIIISYFAFAGVILTLKTVEKYTKNK